MKKIIVLILLIASLPLYAGEYKEVRDLTLDASSLKGFAADVTSGELLITGNDNIDQIMIKATIRIETKGSFDNDDARKLVADSLTIKLGATNNKGVLLVKFDDNLFAFSSPNRQVDLDIQLPSSLYLEVDDGSGLIHIKDMKNGADIEDGSGSMKLTNLAGNIEVDDGSGSLTIDQIQGNLYVDDGSGSLSISNVEGNVEVEDGSGSMDITDIKGSVRVDDGSGSITVKNVSKDFILEDDGSGGVTLVGIQGNIRGYNDHNHRENPYLK